MIDKFLNHNTYVKDVWVDYNGWRFKDHYEIELHNGTKLFAYPNGNAWYERGNSDEELSDFISKNKELINKYGQLNIRDENVKRIRLITDDEVKARNKFGFTGMERDARNISYFGYGPNYNYRTNKFYYRYSPLRINEELLDEGKQTLLITKYKSDEVAESFKIEYPEDFNMKTLKLYGIKDHNFRNLIDDLLSISRSHANSQNLREALANTLRRALDNLEIKKVD